MIINLSSNILLVILLIPVVLSSAGIGIGMRTEMQQQQRQGIVPTFIQEPPNRVDFLNELGVMIPCQASTVTGFTPPQIQWVGTDNKIVQNIDNFRTVHANGTLQLHPFPPAAYRQDLHMTTCRCIASSSAGVLRSRDVQIRAVVAQQWVAKVRAYPAQPTLRQRKWPILIKCEIDLIGGGRDFIQVISWKLDQQHVLVLKPHSVAGERAHLLPNGDLIIDRLESSEDPSSFACVTRHKLTKQEVESQPFFFTFQDSVTESPLSLHEIDRFPESIVVKEGTPLILHCLGGYYSAPVKWEKSSGGGSWLEVIKSSLDKSMVKVGNSLVVVRSKKSHGGHYRCSYTKSASASTNQGQGQGLGLGNTKSLQNQGLETHTKGEFSQQFHVRITEDSFTVRVVINQEKVPLGSSIELVCSTTSDQPVTITWYKDNKLVNAGGRLRISNNILQISQIARDDEGIFQCFARKERESAQSQSAVRVQLAESPVRLLLGFLDQTLGGPGPDISLRCVFHSGYPLPKISWTIDGFPPTADPRVIVGDHVTSHGDMITYFNITGTTVQDGGLYSCKAANTLNTVVHSARLNIYGALHVRQAVPPVVAISGEFLEIQCPVSGYPISGISWEKDGLKLPLHQRQRVASNGTLTISSVEKNGDAGTYTCCAWDSQRRSACGKIQLNVVAQLRIALFPEKSNVVEGDRVTLVCALSSGLGNLKWTKVETVQKFYPKINTNANDVNGVNVNVNSHNRKNVELGNESPFTVLDTDGFTSLLSIAQAKPMDSGKYTCTAYPAFDAISTVSRSHELTVLVPVKIEPFAFQQGLREGSRSRIVCGVTQGDLPIKISFFKDDFPLDLDLSQDPSNSQSHPNSNHINADTNVNMVNMSVTSLDPWSKVLQFSYLTPQLNGLYKCRAINLASEAFYTASLHVHVGPKWIEEPVNLNISRGDEGHLNCLGYGVPHPSIQWFKSTGDGLDNKWRPVETLWPTSSVQTLQNGSLLFLDIEEQHEGSYMCKLENGIGPGTTKIVFLGVHVPPYFTKSLERQSASQGKGHQVTCEVIGDGPMTVSWMKGQTQFDSLSTNRFYTTIHREGKKTRMSLIMKDLEPTDKATYKCIANNSLGRIAQAFELWIEEKPKAPQLTVLEVGSRYVVLEWYPVQQRASGVISDYPLPPPVLMYLVEYSDGDNNNQRLDVVGDSRQVKVDNLSPSTTYTFRVAAVNSISGSGPPAEVVVRTLNALPSGPPTNVRVRSLSSHGIIINWSPVLPELSHGIILGYRISVINLLSNGEVVEVKIPLSGVSFSSKSLVRQSSNSNDSYYMTSTHHVNKNNEIKDDGSSLSSISSCCQYGLTGLKAFSQYEVQIAALNSAGMGPNSQPALVRTAEDVPTSPIFLTCLRLSSQSLQLNWQPPIVTNGIITSYKIIYYPITSTSFRSIETHHTSALTTVINGLESNTNYSVYIKAVSNGGESVEWIAVFCKTLEDVPSSPVDVVGYASTENSFYLNWNPPRRPNGILMHFTIYFRIVDGGIETFESKRKVSAMAVSYVEGQLELSRHKYVFWMTATNGKGESLPSTQILFTPPPLVKPRLVGQSSRLIEIHQGNPLSLHCAIIGLPSTSTSTFSSSASSTAVSTALRWTMGNGKQITMTGNAFIKSGELMFVTVRKSDSGNYTCQPDDTIKNFVHSSSITYQIRVYGIPLTPIVDYVLDGRNIIVSWTVLESRRSGIASGIDEDIPFGFSLFFRSPGSIQEWKKIELPRTSRNFTLRNLPCGSIVNLYMQAFNEIGTSPDSPPISIHVTHQIAPVPTPQQLLLVNSTCVSLNLYPLNFNDSFCPTLFFSVAVRESRPTDNEWILGKSEQIPFRNEYSVTGLKESTSYEIAITTFGHSTSKSATFSFVTLNRYGELPSIDVATKNMVRDYSPFYSNLTLIIPVLVAVLAVIAAFGSVLAYCKTRRVVDHMSGLTRPPRSLPPYETSNDTKGVFPHREQFYSTLPCPPCHPANVGPHPLDGSNMFPDMEDISPYATFQLSDPMKTFHEEGFSQEIVVPKFYDVMQQQTLHQTLKSRRGDKIRGDAVSTTTTTTNSNVYNDDRWAAPRRQSLSSSCAIPSTPGGGPTSTHQMDSEQEEEEDDDEQEMENSDLELRYSILPVIQPQIQGDTQLQRHSHSHSHIHGHGQSHRNLSSHHPPPHQQQSKIRLGRLAPNSASSQHSQGVHKSHLSFQSAEKSMGSGGGNVKNMQRGFVEIPTELETSSEDESPPPQLPHHHQLQLQHQHHHQNQKRRSSTDSKKVSGAGTMERVKRNKDGGRKRSVVSMHEENHVPDSTRIGDGDVVMGQGQMPRNKIEDSTQLGVRRSHGHGGQKGHHLPLENDYSIAV